MAGSGTRLGLPFPKALAPTFTNEGIKPLYWHALSRLQEECDRVVAIIFDDIDVPIERVFKNFRGELPTSIAAGAGYAYRNGYSHVGVALPDSIWNSPALFSNLFSLAVHHDQPVTLGLFRGDARVLDRVEGDVVSLHLPNDAEYRTVTGWGALVISVDAALTLHDGEPLAPQLTRMRHDAVDIDTRQQYYDLGTPERYEKFIGIAKEIS